MLKHMRHQIDRSLAIFMDRIKTVYQLDLVDPILYQSLREYVLRDGKRIRPLLLILSYKGYRTSRQPMSPSIYYVSTCIELLHNFMLIHDDIIDRSDLRRGKPTMHRLLSRAAKGPERHRLGQDLGIVTGDIVYALAIDAFLSIHEDPRRKEEALKYFIQTAVFTAMGEFIDTLHSTRPITSVTEDDVFLNYSLKTARYTFDCPLVVGAILAGAPRLETRRLSEIGLLVGQAFQIQDDIIGIFDSQKNIGKTILSDLEESKKTILVCHANRTLPPGERKKFLQIFSKSKKTYADLVAIRKIFLESGSLHYALNALQTRMERAKTLLEKLTLQPRFRRLIARSLFELFQHSDRVARQYIHNQ